MKRIILIFGLMMMALSIFGQTGTRFDGFASNSSIYENATRKNSWGDIASNLHRESPSGADALIVHDPDLYSVLIYRLDSLLVLNQPSLSAQIASNGVIIDNDTLKLGGSLIENTTIEMDTFLLSLNDGFVKIKNPSGVILTNQNIDYNAFVPGAEAYTSKFEYTDSGTGYVFGNGITDLTEIFSGVLSGNNGTDPITGDLWASFVNENRQAEMSFKTQGQFARGKITVDSFQVDLQYNYSNSEKVNLVVKTDRVSITDTNTGSIASFNKTGGINFAALPSYDDDTAAGTGGLTSGDLFITTGSGAAPLNVAGILMVKQ